MPEPFRVAVDPVMLEAAFVTAVGGNGVPKVSSEPKPVPAEFCPMAQKKYVVPGLRPVMFCE